MKGAQPAGGHTGESGGGAEGSSGTTAPGAAPDHVDGAEATPVSASAPTLHSEVCRSIFGASTLAKPRRSCLRRAHHSSLPCVCADEGGVEALLDAVLLFHNDVQVSTSCLRSLEYISDVGFIAERLVHEHDFVRVVRPPCSGALRSKPQAARF